jgi:antitoxin component of RelBE/YafQ-DinJ toxin-antitoxin module
MSKKTLNLTVEEHIKQRAKRLARQRGMSVSRFFEELVANQEEPGEYKPAKGGLAEKLYNLVPESKKTDDFDYKKEKEKMLKERYGV